MDPEEYQPEHPNSYAEAILAPKIEKDIEKKPDFGEKSKVIVLFNMADEVDESLEEDLMEDVMEESQRFGIVQDSTIFEEPDKAQKVQVYIKFLTTDAAEKCLNAMNGRFYSGRQISAKYYSEEKFDQNSLGNF
ncbi:unnamed protein product [Blepharisma stoltei]|uniref:RRM domain-containing protein n=1 Tax=Blepharisma stoltei TaxID=1481888 RepID=A0AAU9J3W4_9CILI|nr:unnamed protein product [Blepharisma stoltei]